jgi:hypothetical protein
MSAAHARPRCRRGRDLSRGRATHSVAVQTRREQSLPPLERRRPHHHANPRPATQPDLHRRRHPPVPPPLDVEHHRHVRPCTGSAVDVRQTHPAANRHGDRNLTKRIEQEPANGIDPPTRVHRAIGARNARGTIDPEANVCAQGQHQSQPTLRCNSSVDDRIRAIFPYVGGASCAGAQCSAASVRAIAAAAARLTALVPARARPCSPPPNTGTRGPRPTTVRSPIPGTLIAPRRPRAAAPSPPCPTAAPGT